MTELDPAILNAWHVCGTSADIYPGKERRTQLFDQTIELAEPIAVEGSGDVVAVLDIDASRGQGGQQFLGAAGRLMVPIVTEKDQLEPVLRWWIGCSSRGRKAKQKNR